jgi:glycosyltransferase involved in cell wall biosynthesis
MNKKKTVCYWSPHISNVATVKAVINSALSVNRYSNQRFESLILDVFGEWKSNINNETYNLKFHILNYFPKLFKFSSEGFIKSRLKYIIIFFLSFRSLKKFLIREKPEFLIIHLITSLPLLLNYIYKFDTKIILRISGKPQMNFFRYIFWKITLKKVYKITFPTIESLEYLKKLKLVDENKFELLYDPVFIIKDTNKKKNESLNNFNLKKNDYFLAIGRLTKQKNFVFLIKCFSRLVKDYTDIKLVIIGDGEEKEKINRLIRANSLEKNIILLGYQKNVFKFLKNCKGFILSSLWEDPGFVLIEAIVSDSVVISSDCPNGPKEIIKEKNGILFKSNSETDFIYKFKVLMGLSDSEKKELKINAKKKIKIYSIFHHYKKLQNLLDN